MTPKTEPVDLETLKGFTPGNWSVWTGAVSAGYFVETDDGKHNANEVARTWKEANARLMVAAPDLLAEVVALRAKVTQLLGFDTYEKATRTFTDLTDD